MRSGISAVGDYKFGLVSGREVDGYLPKNKLKKFVASHALEPAGIEGNVRLDPPRAERGLAISAGTAGRTEGCSCPRLWLESDPRSVEAGRRVLREVDDHLRQARRKRRSPLVIAAFSEMADNINRITINPSTPEARRLWAKTLELAEAFGSAGQWALIGGLMVQLHSYEHNSDTRPTIDIDFLGDPRRRLGTTQRALPRSSRALGGR